MSQVSHASWQHHGIQTTTDQLLKKKTQYPIAEQLHEIGTKIFDGAIDETTFLTTHQLFGKKTQYLTTEKLCEILTKKTFDGAIETTQITDPLLKKIQLKKLLNKTTNVYKKYDTTNRIINIYEEDNVDKVFNERTNLSDLIENKENVNNSFDTNKNVIKICDERNYVDKTHDKIINIETLPIRKTNDYKIYYDKEVQNENDKIKKGQKTFDEDNHVDNVLFNKILKKISVKNNFNNGSDTQTHNIYYERLVKKEKWKNLENRKTGTVGKRKGERWNLQPVLISLLVLNLVGVNCSEDGTNFSSGVTTRMIASFLGYGHSCSVGGVTRACTLTISCWLRGGTRLRGCGGWLFSCCTAPREYDNSISSSEWKYKVSPPKLRQVPHRAVIPNNVFRRRVDDDVSQVECGLPSSSIFQKRIIGGRQARFAEFPWQAHVRISEFQCGGVLVSRWFVATAAHCVSRAPVRDIVVWLGAVDTSDTQPATKMGITQKILHPLFQFRMTQPDRYDIALLKFTRPITYSNYILPICLPDYDLELRGRNGVIAGWGKTDASSGHTGTNLLRSATVPILSKEQCINWHQSKQISVEIHSEMICAGHSDGHQDACLGDSGGPLIVLDSGRYYLVGITSAGFGCGVDHQPGIYHNVKITADWIRHVIVNTHHYVDGVNRIN